MKAKEIFDAARTLFLLTWLDQLWITVFLLATAGLYSVPLHRRNSRMFPLWVGADGRIVGPPAISHPYVKEILTSVQAALACFFIPIAVILIFQIRLRSIWDCAAGIMGLSKALVAQTFISVILKQYIGAFRPHFLDVCRPNISGATGSGFGSLYFDVLVCQGRAWLSAQQNARDITYALQSFPSGHTSSAFAVGVFLSLYINGKLKAFADYSPDYWKFMSVLAPVIGASIIGGGLIVDKHHHPTDVLFGALLGTAMGLIAYRSSYASVWDYRYNHIPLPPQRSKIRFAYDDLSLGNADDLVVSSWWRQQVAGRRPWRHEEAVLFDSVRRGREMTQKKRPTMMAGGVAQGSMGGGDGMEGLPEDGRMVILSPRPASDATVAP